MRLNELNNYLFWLQDSDFFSICKIFLRFSAIDPLPSAQCGVQFLPVTSQQSCHDQPRLSGKKIVAHKRKNRGATSKMSIKMLSLQSKASHKPKTTLYYEKI
jgi:hypothetical protein